MKRTQARPVADTQAAKVPRVAERHNAGDRHIVTRGRSSRPPRQGLGYSVPHRQVSASARPTAAEGSAMRKSVAAIIGIGLAACGGSFSDPGTPPTPTPPPSYLSVAGNYAGTVTVTYPPPTPALTCSATTTVSQSNDRVFFTPLVLGPACGGTSIVIPQIIIDTQGRIPSFPQTISQTLDCGVVSVVLDGGFTATQFHLSQVFTPVSGTCQRVTYDITLTKQ